RAGATTVPRPKRLQSIRGCATNRSSSSRACTGNGAPRASASRSASTASPGAASAISMPPGWIASCSRAAARAVLKMILEDGCFHADPHQGHVSYLPGNRVAFIAFGMVGRVNGRHREQLAELLFGLVRQQPERAVEVLLDWGGPGVIDEDGLVTDIEAFVDQYRGVPLRELRVSEMIGDVLAILRRHRISLPADLSLLVKAFISLEGMGRELDPDFDMASDAVPALDRLLPARFSGAALLAHGWR